MNEVTIPLAITVLTLAGWVWIVTREKLSEFVKIILMVVLSCVVTFGIHALVIYTNTKQAQALELDSLVKNESLLAMVVSE